MAGSFRKSMMVLNHLLREGDWEAHAPHHPAEPWKLPPQTTYLFKNANVVDVATGVIISNQRVKISNGRIEYVKKTSLSSTLEGVVVVDLQGKYLCPGLIDCHVHLTIPTGEAGLPELGTATAGFKQAYSCQQLLRHGFTTVRDMGDATLALKQAIQGNLIQGPRVLICNKPLSPSGGPGDLRSSNGNYLLCCKSEDGMSTVVDGVADCIRATREHLRDGADFIKIMVGDHATSHVKSSTQFTAEEVRTIVEVAAGHGATVTAHARTPGAIRHAIDNGVQRIEHGGLLDKQTAEYMAQKKIWFTPSFVPNHILETSKDAQPLQVAHEAGVQLCHGSGFPNFRYGTLNCGLCMSATSEMDNKTMLRIATVNAAEMLGLGQVLGQIKAGFAADMLVFKENPLVNKSVVSLPSQNVLAVIKDGRVCVSRWSQLPEDVSPKEMIE